MNTVGHDELLQWYDLVVALGNLSSLQDGIFIITPTGHSAASRKEKQRSYHKSSVDNKNELTTKILMHTFLVLENGGEARNMCWGAG